MQNKSSSSCCVHRLLNYWITYTFGRYTEIICSVCTQWYYHRRYNEYWRNVVIIQIQKSLYGFTKVTIAWHFGTCTLNHFLDKNKMIWSMPLSCLSIQYWAGAWRRLTSWNIRNENRGKLLVWVSPKFNNMSTNTQLRVYLFLGGRSDFPIKQCRFYFSVCTWI